MFEFERATSMDMLTMAWQKISSKNGCPGIDGVDLSFYRSDLRNNLRTLQTALVSGNYKPFTEKRYSNKNRVICIHCVDDKIVQTVAAEIVMSAYLPSKCVHGFVKRRSVFTAKKSLDNALKEGTNEYFKADIKRFYDSIDNALLLRKLENVVTDYKFLSLAKLLLGTHFLGISTGSCFSPVCSNLYLADFDRAIAKESTFYSRYVDDMLVAPASNSVLISEKLREIGLHMNTDKSVTVNAAKGFTFLEFDINTPIDTAIQNGDFATAEELYTAQENDITAESVISPKNTHSNSEYEIPAHIQNVVKMCHIVNAIVCKAKTQNYLTYSEKFHILQIFHCLDDDGTKFIHYVLGLCEDYDYAETQRRITKYGVPNPVGCKKLCERFGGVNKCVCNFSNDKIYPTPIIHAKHIKPDCFTPSVPKDVVGHFKSKTIEHKAEDALSGLLQLNRKAYEIREQQNIFKGQIESLFERGNVKEFQTPQGLLIKTDGGLFIKVD
ncbi:hypothetical protein AGMMS49975_08060 [Clostridia bacterium]|nr:hypothetical protein AGMMS49975_08060 [Clostridia bacterium]